MVNIDILVRTKRKSISISISPQGAVIIKAPRSCPMSEIQRLVSEKENWINLHQQRILNNLQLNKQIFEYKDILFLGKVYHIAFDSQTSHIALNADYCIIPEKYNEKFLYYLIKWYKKNAIQIFRGRVEYFSNLMQVEPSKLRLSNAKGCWGSCNSNSVVSLNWRLMMVPHDLLDYVVVHELAHLLQMNHSDLFWKIVGGVLPDYRERRRRLKQGDYLLTLYRQGER